MDEALERSNLEESRTADGTRGENFETGLVLLVIAVVVFFGCIVLPPSLMDDVDAVQAQIARNMLDSGDWVIARLDGGPYVEKSPLIYWLMAASFRVFGVHDWSARIPVALAPVPLVKNQSIARFAMLNPPRVLHTELWVFAER